MQNLETEEIVHGFQPLKPYKKSESKRTTPNLNRNRSAIVPNA